MGNIILVMNHEDKTMRMKPELCNINVGITALAYFHAKTWILQSLLPLEAAGATDGKQKNGHKIGPC